MEYFYIVKYENEKGEIYNWNCSELTLSEDSKYDKKCLLDISSLPVELNKCYKYLKNQPKPKLGLVFPFATPKNS